MTNNELIKRAQQNDAAAIEELYNQFYPMGISLALQFVKNEQDALDVIQEAFITVFNKLDTLEDATKFKSWYMQIVANKCRDFLKKKNPLSFTDANMYNEDGELQFEEADDDKEFQPEESVDYSETKRIVEEMLNDLPEEQKMCLLLFYVNDMKISEIAGALGVSEATVKSRLKYGKDKLRVSVNEYEEKNGVKLHGAGGASIIPFIRWLLTKGAATPKLPILPFANISAQIGVASAAAATTAATATATTVTAAGIKAVVSGILGVVGNVKALAIGITAIAVTTGIIGGTVLVANLNKNDNNTDTSVPTTSISQSGNNSTNENTEDVNSENVSSNNENSGNSDQNLTNSEVTSSGNTNSEEQSGPQLKLLDVKFDSKAIITGINKNLISGKRNGKWGVVDLNNKVIVPFKYDCIIAPTADGYTVAWNEKTTTENGAKIKNYEYYLYNSSGEITYSTKATANIIVYNQGTTNEWESEESKFAGEKIHGCNEGVLITTTWDFTIEDPDWLSIGDLNLKTPTGKLIKTFKEVSGFAGFEDGKLVFSKQMTSNDPTNLILVDKTGKIIKKTLLQESDGSGAPEIRILCNGSTNLFAGDYILVNVVPTLQYFIINSDLTDKIWVQAWDWEIVYPYYGKYLINKTFDGKFQLVKAQEDNVDNIVVVSEKAYDAMTFSTHFGNETKYALVQQGEKWGYLSLDGKTEKFFDDATTFVDGKAMILQDGKVCIIDENFKKLSDEVEVKATSVSSVSGNIFAVEIDGACYPMVYTP